MSHLGSHSLVSWFSKKLIWKQLCLVFLLNLVLAHGLFYVTYKRYDVVHFGQGDLEYFKLVRNFLSPEPVHPTKVRYRILTPLVVKAMAYVPVYQTKIASNLNEEDQGIFFHFLLFNFLALSATGALCFFYAKRYFHLADDLALLGNFLFLFAFNVVRSGFISINDALTHFFIILVLILYKENKFFLYLISSILGVLQKESVVLIVGLVWCIDYIKKPTKDQLKWPLALGIATLIYVCFTHWIPLPPSHNLSLGVLAERGLSIFSLNTYSGSFIANTFLGYFVMGLAFLGHFLLKLKGRKVDFDMSALLIYVVLVILSLALGVDGGNEGRIAFFAWPVYMIYQLKVIESWIKTV